MTILGTADRPCARKMQCFAQKNIPGEVLEAELIAGIFSREPVSAQQNLR